MFEPFFTTKMEGEGTGLGLAMVYGFIKRSSGYIKVYSERGIGTTFRLYLPKTDVVVPSSKLAPAEVARATGGSETILVVDDEADLLTVAAETLQKLGYQVITAANGNEALQRLREHGEIDLLFSDVVMPGDLNGYQLAEKATAERPGLKVLLTSGFTSKAVVNNGLARFKANLLNKPYTQAELAQRIRGLLTTTDTRAVTNISVARDRSDG